MLFCLGVIQVNAQKVKESEVPKEVKTAFQKKYAGAKEVKWHKEDGAYEASFDLNKKEQTAMFDNMGMLKETGMRIPKSQLPKAIQSTLSKDYAGYKIEEPEKMLAAGVTTYCVEVEKGGKSSELTFDTAGKLLKTSDVKEKED